MSTTVLNREFKFVFCPKTGDRAGKYFGIGAGQLEKYLGASNAEVVRRRANNLTLDRDIVKFRATGRVYIYVK